MSFNSGWRGPNAPPKIREPIFNLPPVIVAVIAVCAFVYVLQAWFLNAMQYTELMLRGAFFPIRYSGWVELDILAFTSPFTYAFLHGSPGHLAVNMIWLAIFGSPLATVSEMAVFCCSGPSPDWLPSGSTTCFIHSTQFRSLALRGPYPA